MKENNSKTNQEAKKDYSKTVLLPQTDFQMKADLARREPIIVEQWDKERIYYKMLKKNAGAKKFIFHDGPPYANAHIHIGTALNRVLKDLIIKHGLMDGYYLPYTPGWDCHGLPIEQLVLKGLKTDKNHVDRLVFRKQAADFANKFVGIQKDEFKRLGTFADWDAPYLTLDPKYEGSILRVFASLVEKGFVYRKNKAVIWCSSCETALADAEVEYADHSTDSIFVKFKIVTLPKMLSKREAALKDFSVLIWTTTAWTLPSNSGLAFSADADYIAAVFTFEDGRKEKIIIAKELAQKVKEKIGAESMEVLFESKGSDFVGILCHNPFDYIDRLSRGINADFVSLDDGSGIVHIAPGHGQEDYEAGLANNLEIISPLNDKGLYTKEVPEYEHMHVFKAAPMIIEKLKGEGKILSVEKMQHSYPHCWRCKNPIIFRATPQWFVSIDYKNFRGKLSDLVRQVNWIPKYGENRIGGMLENRPDWCISRQRLWGVPIPAFYCQDCGEALLDAKIIRKIADLAAEKGSDCWYVLDEKELLEGMNAKCGKCGGKNFKKETDILDVWFDSGSSFEAVLISGNYEGAQFPADLYLEGSDQHRGWFHTSLILSAAKTETAPYKSVLTHGFVVDGQGRKMSKSLGNGVESEQLIKRYGADILRLWTASSDYREDIRISDEILKGLSDSYRKIRNTLRFLLGNLNGFSPKQAIAFKDLQEIDKYALSRLQDFIEQCRSAFDKYEFHKAASAANNFCAVFLSGFYLDAQKDILYCGAKEDKKRLSAQSAMFEILNCLTRLIAPILSFTAEEAWKEIRKLSPDLAESVFLAGYPKVNPDYPKVDDEKWQQILEIRAKVGEACEKLRQEKIIGSNLESALTIKYGSSFAAACADKDLLSLALGSWDIKLSPVSEADALEVEAAKTSYAKCARCWRHIDGIKDDLCPRCLAALS